MGRIIVHDLIVSGPPARLAELGQLPNLDIVNPLTLPGHIVNPLTLLPLKWGSKLT